MAPWADTPFSLIPIKTLKSSSPDATWIASEMGNAHNGLLRALNSMYNQAPYVKLEADIHDLIQYSLFWIDWIEHHHDGEEEFFFPAVQRITGEEDLMRRNIEQHQAFIPGLEAFHKYLENCLDTTKKDTYNANRYQELITSFAPVLRQHLTDEIETLLRLDKFDITSIKKEFVAFDSKMREGEKSVLFPLVMGSSDSTYEGEPLWPPVPGPVRYLIHYYFERKHRSVWRFCPSDTWGVRRELAFGPDKA